MEMEERGRERKRETDGEEKQNKKKEMKREETGLNECRKVRKRKTLKRTWIKEIIILNFIASKLLYQHSLKIKYD